MKINTDKLTEESQKIFEKWPEIDTLFWTQDHKPFIRHEEAVAHRDTLPTEQQFLTERHREHLQEGTIIRSEDGEYLLQPKDSQETFWINPEDFKTLESLNMLTQGRRVLYITYECNYTGEDDTNGSAEFAFIRETI